VVEVLELLTGDDPADWARLGFAVGDDGVRVGRVLVRCDGQGGGVRGWKLMGEGPREVSGVPTQWSADAPGPAGARDLDHIVLLTGRLDASVADLVKFGGSERRRIDVGRGRMAFVRMGATVVEVVERPGPPGLWGLVAVVEDLDALDPELVGEPRDAVQPGRRIATVRREAGLGTALAFMTPRVRAHPG
jgi:hypothetical protein